MGWSFIDDYDERYFRDYDMDKLLVDEFYLNINLKHDQKYFLYTLNKECFECPYLRYNGGIRKPNIFETDLKFRIANESSEYLPQDKEENVICNLNENFGQFGVYTVNIENNTCKVDAELEPKNIYIPILTVILIYAALFSIVYGICYIWKTVKKQSQKKTEKPEKEASKKERIKCLDTFRGVAIVIMIFANYGCGSYKILNHARWNGLHLADLVFPWFMWIMGVCIPISLTSSLKKNISDRTIVKKIIERSVKLFVIGIILGSGTDLKYLRIFGVLQRFAVTYLCCSLICVYCMKRSTESSSTANILKVYFEDIYKVSTGWIIIIVILIIHTTISFVVSAPGCPSGYFGPGGLHKNMSYVNCIGGATGYIDGLILGNHRYQRPTIAKIYEAKPFDPEGIVGCLTSIFHVFSGVQAGVTLLVYKKPHQRLSRWLIWAILFGVLGGSLCGFSKENGLIPVNKNLWSISFVLLTCSFAFIFLCFTYILIDVKKWWSGKPFLFAGMNALLMYIGHELTSGMFPIRWYPHNDIIPDDPRRNHFISLTSDVWGVGMWILISYYWYKIGYFYNI